MNHSLEFNALAAALAKAQAQLKHAVKDSVNPHFKSHYADLASLWDVCREPLTSNGLSVVQLPSADGKTATLKTMLLHSSGQFISSELTMTPQQNTPQSIGSCITYLRRYSLAAIVGIAQDDDDGNAASAGGSSGSGAPPAPPEIFKGTRDQQRRAAELLSEKGIDESLWEDVMKFMMGKNATRENLEAAIALVLRTK